MFLGGSSRLETKNVHVGTFAKILVSKKGEGRNRESRISHIFLPKNVNAKFFSILKTEHDCDCSVIFLFRENIDEFRKNIDEIFRISRESGMRKLTRLFTNVQSATETQPC